MSDHCFEYPVSPDDIDWSQYYSDGGESNKSIDFLDMGGGYGVLNAKELQLCFYENEKKINQSSSYLYLVHDFLFFEHQTNTDWHHRRKHCFISYCLLSLDTLVLEASERSA